VWWRKTWLPRGKNNHHHSYHQAPIAENFRDHVINYAKISPLPPCDRLKKMTLTEKKKTPVNKKKTPADKKKNKKKSPGT
jgi:hypothetical protein